MHEKKNLKIGLVDADLLSKKTRFPNLTLQKIAGFLNDNGVNYELIFSLNPDLDKYQIIFMAKVFTFSNDPDFYTNAPEHIKAKFRIGGTGYYATKTGGEFKEAREADMIALEKDSFLLSLKNKRGGILKNGIDMARQFPDYGLYDSFIKSQIKAGENEKNFTNYQNFSMGFLTRKCVRHCPFCVNRLENGVVKYSELEWFYDPTRPFVYFWDDNILASNREIWKPILEKLIQKKIKFSFKQGLDERQFSENEHGEEMAELLSKARYYGDYIFAFDNWKDKEIIEKSLRIWRRYCPKKSTKFYLFTGFKQKKNDFPRFWRDIEELFKRIQVLMRFNCLGYVMRHEDHKEAPIPNIYIQIARWINQPAFYKKMTFWEFVYFNQVLWNRKNISNLNRPEKQSIDDFFNDVKAGLYESDLKMVKPLKTICEIFRLYPEHEDELKEFFSMSYERIRKEIF